MTADMGNLAISIRSEIGDRPTVQYFGDRTLETLVTVLYQP